MKKKMKEITEKQEALYVIIKDFIELNGYAPTIRELCKITGNKSSCTIYQKLFQLKKKGFITYVDRKSRTIKILK